MLSALQLNYPKPIGFSILYMSILLVSSKDDCTAAATFASVLPCCRPAWLPTTRVLPLGSDETFKNTWVALTPISVILETLFLCVVELQRWFYKGADYCSECLSPSTFSCILLWTQPKKLRRNSTLLTILIGNICTSVI